MAFTKLSLDKLILKAIDCMGYKTPTPIQEKAIEIILKGRDLCACAQTGTGKTAAFLLPTLQRLIRNKPTGKKGPRVLILVPTRELAIQVAKESFLYSKYLKKIKTICIYGGVPYPKQRRDLYKIYDILVATPGRLIDHFNSGKINFSRIETFILDEADRMLDMGFVDDVKKIAANIKQKHQTLLFSATLKDQIISLVKNLQNAPEKIEIPIDKDNIEQRILRVKNIDHKLALLEKILTEEDIHQAIIFTSTKSYADELKSNLQQKRYRAQALHGDIPQGKRNRTIQDFRNNKIRFLVATDVAARGIDIPKISHIINFDLPSSIEDYIHRIGRTARMGKKGLAISFLSSKDDKIISALEKFTNQKLAIKNHKKSKNKSYRKNKRFLKHFKKDKKAKNKSDFFQKSFKKKQKLKNFKMKKA
jgi:superfamily II DNA/RNA helicase